MELYSITPLDVNHVDEICQDLIEQQKTGVSTLALMIMMFAADGTPPVSKAKIYCEKYDLFREKLDAAGVRHGALVQSTLGHTFSPTHNPHPFRHAFGLMDGEIKPFCCALDENFRDYIREQMRELAMHHPEVIMIDDDVGILYRSCKGCYCPQHQAEYERRIGRKMSREELISHVLGKSEEDKYYTQMFIDLQGDGLVGTVQAMREGIDSVDPSIQGAVSIAGNYCEFSDRIAAAFAGKGNPVIARFNNGNYTAEGARWFTRNMMRAAMQHEILEGKIDIFLAETDTCPQNRYSTGAHTLHSHMTGSILEGAKGAKHWITRLDEYEPESGRAYRKILAKYSGFYEELGRLYDELQPFGCRIPLSKVKDYCMDISRREPRHLSGWANCVLERMGFPLYFSGKPGGAVFLDDDVIWKFTDDQIMDFFRGTVFLPAKAAALLNERGFLKYTGVEARPWDNHIVVGTEIYKASGKRMRRPVGTHELIPINDSVESLSDVMHVLDVDNMEVLFPGTTAYRNPAGGMSYVFTGTPDTPFSYATAFSFLNGTRKRQLTDMLKATGNLPVYYPGDIDVYMRAGYLRDGRMMCAMFNISLDPMEQIELVLEKPAQKIEFLEADGSYRDVAFTVEEGVTRVDEELRILTPVVLIIS